MAGRLEEVKTNRPGKIQENRMGKSQDGKMKQAPKNGQQKLPKFRFGKIQRTMGTDRAISDWHGYGTKVFGFQKTG